MALYEFLLARHQSGNAWDARQVGRAPTLNGECDADGPTEDETAARAMFNRLIVHVLG